jgi:hypothetical protein
VSIVLPAIMQRCLNEDWIKVGRLNNVVYTYITRQNAIHGDRLPIHLTIQYEAQVISIGLTMMQFFPSVIDLSLLNPDLQLSTSSPLPSISAMCWANKMMLAHCSIPANINIVFPVKI